VTAQNRTADFLASDLRAIFDDWDVPSGANLRDYPGLTERVIEALDTHAHRIHRYVEDDSYPVILTVSETYVVWVTAETEKAAVRRLQNDGSWYERDRGDATGGWHEARAMERWEHDDVYPEEIGPADACRQCFKDPGWGRGYMPHADTCPVAVARREQREAEEAAREARRCPICRRMPYGDGPVHHKMDCPNARTEEQT
jgi:hypothetical protein